MDSLGINLMSILSVSLTSGVAIDPWITSAHWTGDVGISLSSSIFNLHSPHSSLSCVVSGMIL
jgi:hypothetical protein